MISVCMWYCRMSYFRLSVCVMWAAAGSARLEVFLNSVMSEVGVIWYPLTLLSPLVRTERDVSSWSSECLHQLLLGVQVEGPEGVCHLTEVTKLEGEASINNRKGKLFYFYEWQLRLSWLGQWSHWWCRPSIHHGRPSQFGSCDWL